MPNIRKKNRKFQARLTAKGKSLSATFPTREAATQWALDMAQEIRLGKFAAVERARKTTFRQLLNRYAETITPAKRSQRQELQRIRFLSQHPIGNGIVGELTTQDFAELRDELGKGRKPNTVRLYLSVCQHAFQTAISEWGYSTLANPLKGMRKPSVKDNRDRRLSEEEIRQIVGAIRELRKPWFKWLFFFAILFPQRRGEILGTRWSDVDMHMRRLRIGLGKDGMPRHSPLSPDALALLQHMPRSDDGRLFPLTANAVEQCWKGILAKTGIKDLHWHDLRHEGTSRYALILGKDIFKLKVVTGHKDIRSLDRYVNHKAEDVAFELAGGKPPPPPPLPLEDILFKPARQAAEPPAPTPPAPPAQVTTTARVIPFRPPPRLANG
ncbi:MAG: site-specific integrase/recombinase [bacterium]|nr:MAG: site-specific integrase/recombinase [bacterium]KAF0147505.1 MAG: site-specific integrase/recombinase [bacterium]KAF0165677.1 MAG: site-specific integrase/recombinase [bacterium]TXT19293.1 MAG: site-specific integrase/recombinase [bacterium]